MRKLLFLILLFSSIENIYSQYPYSPTTTQTRISGSIGERRGANDTNPVWRYHKGVDFFAASGTNAVTLQASSIASITLIGTSLAIGNYGYIHVTLDPMLLTMPPTNTIAIGDVIGTVDGAAHIHLQRATNVISTMTPVPMSWEDNSFDENHMVGITPFLDNDHRDIEDIRLYRDLPTINNTIVPNNITTPTNITSSNELFGKIDIFLNAEDFGINANGTAYNTNGANRLAYRIADFKIFDNISNQLFDSDDINFDMVPPNASAPICFHPTLGQSNNWAFFLTHDPFNMPYNRYWNSRQSNQANSTYLNTTDMPMNAEYQDGKNIYFEGRVEDYGGNSDTRTLPLTTGTATVPTNFYSIDNFWPYMTSVSVSQDGIPIANLNRLSSEGGLGTENNGNILVNKSYGLSFDNAPNSFIELVVTFSEPMEDVDFSIFDQTGQVTQVLTSGLTYVDVDRKIWEGSFTMNIDAEQELQLEFTGSDRAGHEIMDIHQLTNSNSPGIINLIPTRTDVTTTNTTGWNNFPNAYGTDAIDLKFGCFGASVTDNSEDPNRSLSNSNCQFILNPSFEVSDASCGRKGSVTLNYEGTGIPFEILEFSNTEGDIVGSGSIVIKNLDPGIYTYLIVDGCCTAEGSIEILGPEQPIYTATFVEGASPAGGVDIFLAIDIPEGLGSVIMEITNMNTGFSVCGKLFDSGQIVNTECTGLTAGDEYCIEFRWGEGCSLEECFIAEGDLCPDDLYVFESFIEPTCADASNGSILLDIESSNCDSPNILWSNGESSDFIEGLSPGVYSVTISATCSGVSCDSYKSFEVPILPQADPVCFCPPIVVEAITHNICIVPTNPIVDSEGNIVYIGSTTQNGIISLEVNQGAGDFTFAWNDGGSTESQREITSPGEYCVTITDICMNFVVRCFIIERVHSSAGYCVRSNFASLGEVQSGFVEITDNWDKLPQNVAISDSYNLERDIYSGNKARYVFKQNGSLESKGTLLIRKVQSQNNYNSDILENATISESAKGNSNDKPKLNLHPNPFIDNFNIEVKLEKDSEVKLSVYDLNGRVVKGISVFNLEKGENSIQIQDVSDLADGVYIVNLSAEDWSRNIQVVKMNN